MKISLVISLEKDVNDKTISSRAHDPEEEEEDSKEVLDKGVDRGELVPVLRGHCQNILRGTINVFGSCKERAL